ncbi:ATP-binding protein [Cryptosporangium aurantiacum]|uniref:histidine kinase n=1 Tax=Cryptosporangium aurantiacum TaxID=134849 RepID=A0A1M7R7J9_9ACTN|nr:ATP-binding protein [Cryptosporangium aurantiacum]SHN42121.1 Signal transduction histidine kinase [Cryptosporangium aurantiacum]
MTSTASILRAGFGALVALLLLLGGARLAVGQYLATNVDATIGRAANATAANAALLQALTDAETGLRGYQLTGERSFLEPYRRGIAQYPAARDVVVDAADDSGTDALRALVATQVARADAWLAFAAPLAGSPAGRDPGSAAAVARGKALFDQLRAVNTQVSAEFHAQRTTVLDRFRTITLVSDVVTALLTILAAVVALVLGLRTTRLFVTPLENIRTTLARLNRGDRSARGRVTGPPEVRKVVREINELADESERLRSSEADRARIRQEAHDLGASVSGSLDRDAILDQVVAGLGVALGVDYVYVRLAEGGSASSVDRLWNRQGRTPPSVEAFREATAATPWPRNSVWADRSAPAQPDAPDRVLAAAVLAAGGARSCLLTGFAVDGEASGLIVLVQADAARTWTGDERALLEAVAADAGRGLHVAQVYGHQRELAERFQDLDRQKTDFISTVSHELRTPLTSILGYLEILLSGDQGELTEAQERSLKVVERNAERLRELVGDLLTLSRIGSGSLEMTATRVEIASLVESVRGVFGPVAAGSGLTLECDAATDLAVNGDARQLERVLLNLVGNAVKFTPAGGTVRVVARPERADRVIVEITDTGIGIPVSDQERLFQPFQRASNAVASAIQGTGLGLAIARSIVERHGGEVTLRSAAGEGTMLTLVLPRAVGAPSDDGEDESTPADSAIRAAKARALTRSLLS